MRRKVHHDAVNNQEDEDSSVYPIRFLSDETPVKRKISLLKKWLFLFFGEAPDNKDELTRKYF